MKRATTVAALVAGVLLTPSIAAAHMGSAKFIEVETTATGATVEVDVASVDAAIALGRGTSVAPSDLSRHGALLSGWLARGLEVRDATGPCDATPGSPRLTERDAKRYVTVPIVYACEGAALALRDNTVFDDDPDHEVFVSVSAAGGSEAHVLRAGAQELRLSTAPSTTETVGGFLKEGAVHLFTGYDHLLFLLSLILVAGMAVRRDGLGAALRDIAWIVTAFTLGHSISLVSAALGLVALPSAWVEAAIAGSIVVVAAMNIVHPEAPTRATRRSRAALAGVFGLVHGFGFSSVLGDVGLPVQDRIAALASFNIGIELAQLVFVAIVLVPLAALARHPGVYRRVAVQAGSLAIAAFGAVWLVERTASL